jgi:predicted MFS family arabinose efflux permease
MVLGFMGFVAGVPAAFMAPFAGVMADRNNPYWIVLATETSSMLQALLLATLVYFNQISISGIIVLVFILGIINGIDTPVRQMFVARLVNHKKDIGNAVACNSIVYDLARMLGPALGGLILVRYSEGLSFLFNGVSHAFVVTLYLFIRLPPQPLREESGGVVDTLVEGVRYAISFRGVWAILILSACLSFGGSSYMTLMPVMSATVLKGGPSVLGFLLGSVGVGAIVGGLYFSFRQDLAGLAQLTVLNAGFFGLGLLIFSQSHLIALSLIALCVAGFGIMVMMASCSTILLTIIDMDKQGRVLSLFTLSFLSTAPLGSLCTGALADKWGASLTIMASALLCLLAALWFWYQTSYLERLITEVSTRND